MKRLHAHWLLALLLVFAQQVAVVHLAGHAAERLGDRQTTTHSNDSYCPKCSLYASFGSSPPSAASLLKFERITSAPIAAIAFWSTTRTVVAYQSRAPPVLL
jgi:uncharacterized protein (UPF0276 family)